MGNFRTKIWRGEKISRKKDGNEGAKERKTRGDEEQERGGERRGKREERNTKWKEVKEVNKGYRIENPSCKGHTKGP